MFFTTLTNLVFAQSVTGTVYSDDDNTYGFQVQLTYTQTVNRNYISAIDIPTPQYLVWRNSSSTAVSGFDNIQFNINNFLKQVTFDGYDKTSTSSTTPLSISSGSIAFIHNHFPYGNGFVLNYSGKNANRMAYKGYKDGSWYTLKQVTSTTSLTPEYLTLEISQEDAESFFGQYTSYMAVVYIESGYIKEISGQSVAFTFADYDYSEQLQEIINNTDDILDALSFSDSDISSIDGSNDSINDAEVVADMSDIEDVKDAQDEMSTTFETYIDTYDSQSSELIDVAFDTSSIAVPLLNISAMFDSWFSQLGALQIVIYLSFLLELLFVVFFGIVKTKDGRDA